MAYFFSTPVDIDIVLDDGDDRQMVDMKTEKGRREKAPLYKDGESVKGAVTIRPKDGKRLEHTGIKVQFIGTIGRFQCRIPWYGSSQSVQKCSSTGETTTSFFPWGKN
jgi:vacuolar protein sorting-associated protein 26